MEKAFFTDIRSEIIPLLNNAKNEVLIAMAWFTSAELFDALLSCRSRGVRVELVLLDNPINYMYYAPDFNLLINSGGNLWIAKQSIGFMHHKFCIIDNKEVITGSYNWTYYAETRNVENIVITDVPSVVRSYYDEFKRLLSDIKYRTPVCPRLSWAEIQQWDDVDYREINYEIEHICETKNLPIKNVVKTNTVVQVVETKRTPFARKCIGIEVIDNDKNSFDSFIEIGQQLPFKTEVFNLFFDSKNEMIFPCSFICGIPNKRDTWTLVKEVDLISITKGTADENLLIQFSMSLDVNGSLQIDVTCPSTGKKMMISALDSNFVKYE